jgi:glycosyltransferase involved in cell wall biosynthesis
VEISIYGILEDREYWRSCQVLADSLPDHVRVRYEGALRPDQVVSTLSGYDVFFFPTKGENFGHVVLEALAAGLPVLLSDQTPWRHLEALGIGWDIPLVAAEGFAAALEGFAALGPEERQEWRHRAMQHAAKVIGDDGAVVANRALFDGCVRGKSQLSRRDGEDA